LKSSAHHGHRASPSPSSRTASRGGRAGCRVRPSRGTDGPPRCVCASLQAGW
jgi:hypothetical protein